MVSFWVWLTLVTSSSQYTTPTEMSDIRLAPGALIERLGNILYIKDHVEIRIDISALNNLTTIGVRDMLEKSENMVSSISANEKFAIQENKLMLIGLLEQNMAKLRRLLPDQDRERRALLGFIGAIAHELVGTVDDATFNAGMSGVYDKLRETVKTYNVAIKQVNAMQDNIRKAERAFTSIQARLDILEKDQIFRNNFEQLSFMVNQHCNHVEEMIHRIIRLGNGIIEALQGTVLPSFIAPQDVRNFLGKMAKDNHYPLFNFNEDPTSFYTSLTASISSTDLYLYVPLRQTHKYSLYQLHPCPTKINSSFVQVDLESRKVIQREDIQAVAEVTESDINRCRHINQNLVCEAQPLAFFHAVNTCPKALLTGELRAIRDQCKFQKIESSTTPFVLHLRKLSFLYFFYKEMVGFTCRSTTKDIEAVGVLMIPGECSLRSDELTISTAVSNAATYRINLTFSDMRDIAVSFQSYTVNNDTVNFDNMYRLREMGVPGKFHFIHAHPLFIYGFPILAGILVAFACKFISCCRCLYVPCLTMVEKRRVEMEMMNTRPSAPPSYPISEGIRLLSPA